MSDLTLRYKLLHPSAKAPVVATAGAACFDLHIIEDLTIRPGDNVLARTGLAFEIPAGHVMLLFIRSGLAAAYSISLTNAVGVIDSDYRGEVMALLSRSPMANGIKGMVLDAGSRVMQGMILPLPLVTLAQVDKLNQTDRGAGGFGSTGVCFGSTGICALPLDRRLNCDRDAA